MSDIFYKYGIYICIVLYLIGCTLVGFGDGNALHGLFFGVRNTYLM